MLRKRALDAFLNRLGPTLAFKRATGYDSNMSEAVEQVERVNEIEHWPVTKLKPYKRNAKLHPPEQIALLARVIARHGFDQPIVVDKRGTIVKGHGRWLAAKELGLPTVPVVVRDLNETQAAEARIADNRVSEFGWDFDVLVADITSAMSLDDFDLTLTGFSDKELGLVAVSEHVRGLDGSTEISESDIGKGEHECPRCNFCFD